MSDTKVKHLWMTETIPANGDKPEHTVWTRIGVAFENRDGSWSMTLSAIPVNGKIQMRDAMEKP